MVQIPLLSGIYANEKPDLRTSYPVNCVPVPKSSGISEGYLRPGDGIVGHGTGPGIARGGINWNGTCFRVMGSKLVTVDAAGTVVTIGDVGTDGKPVSLDYGFTYLAIGSAGNLFLYDGSTLTQVTDPDLGTVVDMVWIDGYYMTTDGDSLVVTDLNDPFAVNPLKYGSSEADPDPIDALLRLRNEVYALNRYTIEVFDNIGGNLFPFQRIEGAQIQKGCVGPQACCVYLETIAFLGSGRNEQCAVYLGANGVAQKISTHEIDLILQDYSDAALSNAVIEARNYGEHQFLYIHLVDRTLVYDGGASAAVEKPVWFVNVSTYTGFSKYRARFFVRAYNKWLCADTETPNVGYLVQDVSTHWGDRVRWEFGTIILYNDSAGAIFNELELVGLTGSYPLGEDPVISTSYSVDGVTWSSDRVINAGVTGERAKRLCWFQQGHMRNWRIQRFRGTSDAHMGFVRLEAQIEPLSW